MDYLSVCAIVKDENAYLPEWLEYHRLVGVERFYIYDNGSRTPLSETLSGEGRAVVTSLPGHARQSEAYTDCVRRHGTASVWMAFIDVDEFLFPRSTDDLRAILRAYEDFAGLSVNWRVFGTSGHASRPEGLQVENFLLRTPDQFFPNSHIKTIAQPRFVESVSHAHFCSYAPGRSCVNLDRSPVHGPFDPSGLSPGRPLQLNHYYTRSRSEFGEKIARGGGDGSRAGMEDFVRVENECSVRDEGMLRFAPALRSSLARRQVGGR